MDFKEYKAKVFAERPEVKEEYDVLAPQYEIIRAEIESRRAIGMTQKHSKTTGRENGDGAGQYLQI